MLMLVKMGIGDDECPDVGGRVAGRADGNDGQDGDADVGGRVAGRAGQRPRRQARPTQRQELLPL